MLAKANTVAFISEGFKVCGHCGISKPFSEFSKDKHQKKDGLNNKCRSCCKESYQSFAERKYGAKPLNENKTCSQYLGIHVAERILSNLFKNVQRMPLHNHGYDFICNRGFKVDVKSSTLLKRRYEELGWKQWQFDINNNTIADYFLCLAFDNREDLNPVHLWLIPSVRLCSLQTASIGEKNLKKWSQYERPIDKVLSCCEMLKEEVIS